jgi:hypothetical protein
MYKITSLLSFKPFLAILMGSLCFGITNIFSQSGEEKDWLLYKNEVYNFQISYPISWNVIDASIPISEFGLRFSAPYNVSSHNINEMVTLDILKTDQIYPGDTYSKLIINSKAFQEYYKLITFDDVDINGIPAKKIEYINDEFSIPLKMLNYVIVVDRNVFTFTYGEDFETYPKFLNTIEKIVKSFQIIN